MSQEYRKNGVKNGNIVRKKGVQLAFMEDGINGAMMGISCTQSSRLSQRRLRQSETRLRGVFELFPTNIKKILLIPQEIKAKEKIEKHMLL